MDNDKYIPVIQAAGHEGSVQSVDGDMFIKANAKDQEVAIYAYIADDTNEYAADLQLITWPYMGILTELELSSNAASSTLEQKVKQAEESQDVSEIQDIVEKSKSNGAGLVLVNATSGIKEPSVLDVKLGKKLWDHKASEEKRKRMEQVANSTTSGSMGMRIAGMNVYDCSDQSRTAYDRMFGRTITEDEVSERLDKFFAPGFDVEMKLAVCGGVVKELEFIYDVMRTKEMRLVSSSILICYESDPQEFQRKIETQDDNGEHGLFNCKLIDFAHTYMTPGQGPDEDFLEGVSNLIKCFRELEELYDKQAENSVK